MFNRFNHEDPMEATDALVVLIAESGDYGRAWYRDPKLSGDPQVTVIQVDGDNDWVTVLDDEVFSPDLDDFVRKLARAVYAVGNVRVVYAATGREDIFTV